MRLYKVVSASTPGELASAVNQAFTEGYETVGGLTSYYDPARGHPFFFQGMAQPYVPPPFKVPPFQGKR